MMLASERHGIILAELRQRGTVRLSDLAVRLGVSAVTVRRDVTELEDQGLLARVHGGATLPRSRAGQQKNNRNGVRPSAGVVAPGTLVGMVAPSVEYYWPPVIQGAQTTVAAAGGRLILRPSSYDPAEDRRQVGNLLDRGVHTLLIAPTTNGRAGTELLRWLGSLAVPVVLVERLPPQELPMLGLDAATTAHALGAGLALRHLMSLGHRRVGLVTSRSSPTRDALRRGWREAGSSLGLDPGHTADLDVPPYGSAGWPHAYDEMLTRLRAEGVTALLVHSDREAIGLIALARHRGITVPGDLAIVTYDDEVAAASDPPLTAVCPQKHRLGVLAAELALARVADRGDRPVHRVQLWPTLVVRESCGAHAIPGAC
ncbi:substrate-binding domain-containing protein [Amycolatopsis orientalis]|uniref:substrate-binding domain-containing protein n=1 Tax=Amycolatopsis orientalis TaxID=31958 RepID=UPI0003FD18B9|nr:substrate-binding domain-containing protein [Amycolatopsis orientalis]